MFTQLQIKWQEVKLRRKKIEDLDQVCLLESTLVDLVAPLVRHPFFSSFLQTFAHLQQQCWDSLAGLVFKQKCWSLEM